MATKRSFIKAIIVLAVLGASMVISPKVFAGTCTDSDGGQNYLVKGYVNLSGYGWDYCSNAATLIEQDCGIDASGATLNYGRSSSYVCPNGCSEGVCLPAPTTPAIQVASPNGGEQWIIGKTVNITWKRNWMPEQANGLVSIAIKKGDGMSIPIAQNIPDASGYSLSILPSMFIHGNDYKIVVTSNGYGNNLSDESDNYFSIIESTTPLIKVIYPNGGEQWEAGKAYTIKWYATVYDKVRINIDCEGYSSGAIMDVSSGINIGSGYYSYTVPANWPAQNQCKVQVSENLSMLIGNTDGVNYDMSDGYFSIVKDKTPPSAPTGIKVSHQSSDASNVLKFDFTLPVDADFSFVKIYKSSVSGQLGSLAASTVSGYKPGAVTGYYPYMEINATGIMYYTFHSVDLGGNESINKDQYSYNWSFLVCDATNFAAKCNGATATVIPNYSPYLDQRDANLALDGDISTEWMGSWDTNEPMVFIVKMPNKVAISTVKIYFNSKTDYPYVPSDPTVPDDAIYLPTELQIDFNEAGVWVRKTTDTNIKTKGWRTYSITGNTDEIRFTAPDTWAWNKHLILGEISVLGSVITSNTGICLPDYTLIKLPNDPKIYVIIDCQKKWIQTIEEFNKNNYSWSSVKEDTTGTINQLPNYAGAVNNQAIAEGAIIQVNGDPDVYIVKYVGLKKFKRLILSPSVFRSYGHLRWENIIKIDQGILNSFTTSDLVRSENGSVYKLVPNGDTGTRNHVKDMIAFSRLVLDMDAVYQINTVDENSYIQGQELE